MSFKTVSFAVVAAILLGGCAFWQSDPKPIAGNPDFDNYEINLIHAKRLNCGLRVVHYALKFPNSARKDKFAALIKQKTPIFLAQMPQVECK